MNGVDFYTNLSVFSGAGGLDFGSRLAGGIRTVCYVECDRYAQAVLQTQIRSGGIDEAPTWDDVTTFDGVPWRGGVDIISGGFPCQDVSFAGKRAGIKPGNRSGLWNHFARIIREVQPRGVLIENVLGLLSSRTLYCQFCRDGFGWKAKEKRKPYPAEPWPEGYEPDPRSTCDICGRLVDFDRETYLRDG